jgi:integrase
MPVKRRPHGKIRDRWRVIVHWQGRQHEKIVRGSKEDARRFEARWLADLEAQQPSAESVRSVPSLSAFLDGPYSAHARMVMKPSTMSNRVYKFATLKAHFGEMRLSDIDANAVESFQQARSKLVRASTVNGDVTVLLAVLNYARRRGLPVSVPHVKPLPERGKRKNADAWTREELVRLLDTCAALDPGLLPVLVCLANTGMRRGEALALTWENVQLEQRVIRIWASEEWQPKDGDNREVPINDELYRWLARTPEKERHGHVFTTGTGRRRVKREDPFAYWPQRRFDNVRKAAGLVGGPHRLRHSYASHFLEAEPDIYLLGRLLGHSSAHVTELYGHLIADSMTRARAAVNFAASSGPAMTEAKRRWGR